MTIDGERLKKAITSKKMDKLNKIPDDDKEIYVEAYMDGAIDTIESLIEQMDEQIKEGANGVI